MFAAMVQAVPARVERPGQSEPPGLDVLLHRLSNQLGIILAHAELLEAKLGDEPCRSRASQVISSTLGALNTAREIRGQLAQPLAPARGE